MILVSEDVWSADFEALAQEFTVVREPDLWNKKEDLKAKISTATALVWTEGYFFRISASFSLIFASLREMMQMLKP